MRIITCSSCSFRVSEADRLWDKVVRTKLCPKCSSNLGSKVTQVGGEVAQLRRLPSGHRVGQEVAEICPRCSSSDIRRHSKRANAIWAVVLLGFSIPTLGINPTNMSDAMIFIVGFAAIFSLMFGIIATKRFFWGKHQCKVCEHKWKIEESSEKAQSPEPSFRGRAIHPQHLKAAAAVGGMVKDIVRGKDNTKTEENNWEDDDN